jgi:predicted DNA-binding transcriptional regulator YafY
MRADRLLSILLLLQVHRRLTAGELARRLSVSERTIYRDMDALSAAGVPVYTERGQGGGCLLLEEYRTRPPGLSDAEVQTLFLATPDQLLDDLGLRHASDGALLKLLAALPAFSRRAAEYARGRILVDTAGWQQAEDDPRLLPALQTAVWQDQQLRLGYRRGDDTVERVVDPLGLVAKGSLWYLVAAVDGEPRVYRVSRIATVEPTGRPATRPPDFDLAAYWARSQAEFKANLPRYRVRMRVAPEILPLVQSVGTFATIEQQGEPEPDGWFPLLAAFQSQDTALAFAFRFAAGVEILAPEELRAQGIETAVEVAARYGNCNVSRD